MPATVIGSQQSDLFTNHTIFALNRVIAVLNPVSVKRSFQHANEYVRTIVPLISNPKNNSPRSARSLHFTLPSV